MLNTHTFAATAQIVSSRGAYARISINKRLKKVCNFRKYITNLAVLHLLVLMDF